MTKSISRAALILRQLHEKTLLPYPPRLLIWWIFTLKVLLDTTPKGSTSPSRIKPDNFHLSVRSLLLCTSEPNSELKINISTFFHSKHLLLVRVHALCGWAMSLNVFKASAHFLLNLFVLLLSFADTVEAEERGDLILKRTKDLGKTFTIIHEDIYSFGYIGAFLFFSVMEDPVRWLDHYLYTSIYRVVYIPSI